MSIATAQIAPAAYRALPVLRIAALLLAVPALFSGVPVLLVAGLATFIGLGAWMMAMALGKGGPRPGTLSKRGALALVTDGLAMIAAGGFFLGVLTTGSVTAAATTFPGFLAIAVFAALNYLHHKAHRATRRNRRR